MARNSEKAMTALARWRQLKIDSETSGGRYNGVRKRPFLAEECSDVRFVGDTVDLLITFAPGVAKDGDVKSSRRSRKKWRKSKTLVLVNSVSEISTTKSTS